MWITYGKIVDMVNPFAILGDIATVFGILRDAVWAYSLFKKSAACDIST